jgi:hypothetical protein
LKIRHWFFEFYKRDILVVISSTGKSSIVAHEPVPTPGWIFMACANLTCT